MNNIVINNTEPFYKKNFFFAIEETIASSTKKVGEYVLPTLSMIKSLCSFPFRYLSAKTWSIPGVIIRLPYLIFKRVLGNIAQKSLSEELFGRGYSFGYKTMTKEQVKTLLPYVSSAAFVHSSDPEWIEPFGYRVISPQTLGIDFPNVEAHERCFFDPHTSLKVVLIEKGDEIVISFGAIRCGDSEISDEAHQRKLFHVGMKDVVQNLVGGIPSVYSEAEAFFIKLRAHSFSQGKKITLAGQCQGGTLASYIALKHKIPAYCFNTFPFGAGLQQEIGEENLQDADLYLTHLKIERDFLNNGPFGHFIDHMITGIGFRTPGTFGKLFTIPTAYKKSKEIHDYVLGSMMHYLGFDKRAKPKDVIPL